MITKVTNDNYLEFYKPRFDEITAALATAHASDANIPNVVISNLDDYFANIEYIRDIATRLGHVGKYLVVPFDEPYFEIDANARTIEVPKPFQQYGVGVSGDHNAEMLVLKIARYFDNQDFMNTKIAINWSFTPAGAKVPTKTGSQDAFAQDDELEPGFVVFGFIVTNQMTPEKGTLTFAVTCYDAITPVNPEDEVVFNYSFNTQNASVSINTGLELKDPRVITNASAQYLSRLVNSVYTNDSLTPVVDPVWISGDLDDEGKALGLPAKMYFAIDSNGVEAPNLILTAKAFGAADGSVVKYTWISAPNTNDETVVREASTVTVPADYVITTDAEPQATSVYYTLDIVTGEYTPFYGTDDDAVEKFEDPDLVIYELQSSYTTNIAGSYQVRAQNTREVAQSDGTVKFNNSNPIISNVCTIPVAVKPLVELEVAASLTPEEGGFELEEDYEGPRYIYINGLVSPEIKAILTPANAEEEFGAIAVELLDSEEEIPNLTTAMIENNDPLVGPVYNFVKLPDGENSITVASPSATEEGIYQVRAINRRNHTYGVSDPSEEVRTSRVAPEITKITVKGREGDDEPLMLDQGEQVGENPASIELNARYTTRVFSFVDETPAEDKYYEEIAYFLQEQVISEDPELNGTWVDKDNAEISLVVDAENGNSFALTRDPGIFRMRIETKYHGTIRNGYTDTFRVTSILS